MKPRFLTKSRFKMATECPTKLFYTAKKEYADSKLDDPFLAALADGGFQIGELAKCYYPNGHDITSLDYDEAERQTLELLKQDEVVIFEPAIRFDNLFVRIDILVKKGNTFELIEVKAKSYSTNSDSNFIGARGGINASWKPYLFDVAFQKHVLASAFPNAFISSYLMLVDKRAKSPTDGLNQKFLLTRDVNNRKGVTVSNSLSEQDLATPLLAKVNVDEVIEKIYAEELTEGMPVKGFKENVAALSEHYQRDIKVAPVIGKKCKKCEFKCTSDEDDFELLSGFKECWQEQLHWSESDFNDPSVLDIWNFRRAEELIAEGKIKIKDLTEDDFQVNESDEMALSASERQWMQIEKVINNDTSIYFDSDSIEREMSEWTFPLHFIDFETNASAIPFFKDMSPYEGIAFQFSHHIIYEDGKVEHAGEFLNTEVGAFPNFEFVRELKRQLENGKGTIFRYSPHENTYLNMIYRQLQQSDLDDKNQLCEFIKTITTATANSNEQWRGERNMVDLWDLVKKYYYDPSTNGSNSIKAVLPAILKSSQFVREKYSKAIYGTATLPSLNFNGYTWLKTNPSGELIDPYKNLPKMFDDMTTHDVELLSEGDELNNGGLALTAYAKMQFTQMSDYEREELRNALLKYCELDTLAMVMIVEAWIDWMKK